MRYCLFCREAFEDDVEKCPYCHGELADSLPGPDEEETGEDYGAGPEEERGEVEEEGGPLVQVAIVEWEEHLRDAVGVFEKYDIYFEIEEVDRAEVMAGIVPGRAWRLLVPANEAENAFLKLATEVPAIFPPEVREGLAREAENEGEDECAKALERLRNLLDSGDAGVGPELARAVVTGFACDDAEAVGRAKYALALRGQMVGPLLAGIAREAVASGGEGAERVLYNTVEILEVIGYSEALEEIAPLYESDTPQVRARAAYASGRLGAVEAVEGLLALLEDPDEEVRYEAGEAIWRLTGMDFDFDPYAPLQEQLINIQHIRDHWQAHAGEAGVRGRRTLSDLLNNR